MPCTNCHQLIEAAQTITACECPTPGFCHRHNCDKRGRLHTLCRTRQDYFDLWERGEGPCLGGTATTRRDEVCLHRGAQLETILCDLCGERGNEMEVFACDLHGRCSARKQHSKVKSCASCGEYEVVKTPVEGVA